MDNFRPLLYISLLFVLFVIWQDWEHAHQPTHHAAPAATSQKASGETKTASNASGNTPVATSTKGASNLAGKAKVVHIRTDRLNLTLTMQGGQILEAKLPTYPVSVNKPNVPFTLMFHKHGTFVAQSGVMASQTSGKNNNGIYHAQKSTYVMNKGEKILRVPLTRVMSDGIKITKTYVFHRGSFLVHVNYDLKNTGSKSWNGNIYSQLVHSPLKSHTSLFEAHSYQGPAYYDGSYQKISFSDMAKSPLNKTIKNGWMAMVQHYFLVAWIPEKGHSYNYFSKVDQHAKNTLYMIGYRTNKIVLTPGQSAQIKSRMWIGPELQNKLDGVAPGLDLTTGYGIFTFIAKPLFWLLSKIHSFVGNWGFAIILLTLLIKIAFYKLSATSYRSMAKMRNLQPKMQALKERYADDRQKLSQATMELYKTEKINPLGGCLPIVVQIPVFIALYWVLLESVELRQAPFILWIHDLSARDPYFVLPVIMGLTMFLQQRLNPAPMDPLQKRIMTIMPLGFAAFMSFFPAGLVLYWVVNNTLSIGQQWLITRRIAKQNGK